MRRVTGSDRHPEDQSVRFAPAFLLASLSTIVACAPATTVSKEQRPEADVNIEFQSNSKMAEESQKLAWFVANANEKFATDYPATVGRHMTNTDSTPFMDIVASISLRENERGAHIGAGWDPNWHQPTDMYSTYTDNDFRLGLNAAQTTLAAVAQLAGAKVGEAQ